MYKRQHKCLANLRKLVIETNSYLVISSTWRKTQEGMERLLEVLSEYDLDKLVIACTPSLGLSRGEEIKRFLLDFDFSGNINFVILDNDNDMGDLLPYLVQTNQQVGLTEENVQQAIKILTKSYTNVSNHYKR